MKIEKISPDFHASFGKEAGCASTCHGAHQETRVEDQALQRFNNAYLLSWIQPVNAAGDATHAHG
ncbi:hypothetical protein [Polaromonas sp. UBA4122]|uniref:hypothetical protein n=1 Tax=Polaromonas sp. UBA4122 TaxID=1947074 RepID=UPI0025F50ABA|nr:hypothetical protein [Polaromonas sp. UBA4122]